MADGAASNVTAAPDSGPADPNTAWRDKIKKSPRPSDKPFGRCLVDFLNENTDSGLRPLEELLLDRCAKGEDVNASDDDKRHKKAVDAKQASPSARLDESGFFERLEMLDALCDKSVRAGFLRFLILGGDACAPVHEAGIQLWNARIDGDLELRSCKCVSRVALTNCILAGQLWMQDARLDVLLMSGSSVKGFHANRAKISGAMWLDENFYAEGEVELFGIEIGGRLDCSSGYFAAGIEAPGADIGGDLNLSRVTAAGTVSFVNADIGGSMIVNAASLVAGDQTRAALAFSRAKIKGDASFSGATIYAKDFVETKAGSSIDAQNITVNGSVTFGGGFVAKGEVNFNGADVAKTLDFSGGVFRNQRGYAIRGERSKVAGSMKFNPAGESTPKSVFQAFGCVSLAGAQCGDINCDGGRFHNPAYTALFCDAVNVSGTVFLRNSGATPFQAFGRVSLYTAQIGQHLDCGGGQFQNPGGQALNGEASRIGGCVFLNGPNDLFLIEPKQVSAEDYYNKRSKYAFSADGKVTFVGASVGLQFICQWGQFHNASPASSNPAYADDALNLSAAKIADVLFLGVAEQKPGVTFPDIEPARIDGSISLAGASVRVLIDDGLVDHKTRGLRPTVTGTNGELRCNIKLDQLVYDRLNGDKACNAELRKVWLRRQPPETLQGEFKPQPFEQLITVMRAMGYDDEADDIALFKRRTERRGTPLLPWPKSLQPARESFFEAAAGFFGLFSQDLPSFGWLLILAGATGLAFSGHGLLAALVVLAWLSWRLNSVLARIGELLFVDWFVGYGYQMGRAVVLLLLLVGVFGSFYNHAFQQGAIVPADKDIRDNVMCLGKAGVARQVWSVARCPEIADQAIPLFNAWLYSADVMVPVVSFGQKAAWAPTPGADVQLPVLRPWKAPTNFVYNVQLVESVLGWIEGFLLVSFVTGLISKGGGGKDQ